MLGLRDLGTARLSPPSAPRLRHRGPARPARLGRDGQPRLQAASGPTTRISGTVSCGLFGFGISGIRMNGLPGDPKTDSSGHYHATVPDGWSGTVYPQSTWLHFDPDFRVYTNVTSNRSDDYDTTLPSPVISGTVYGRSNGQPVPGVVMHGLPGTPVTNYHGYYLCQVRYGFSGTATPQLAGYTFSPSSISYHSPGLTTDDQDYTAIADDTVVISGYVLTAAAKAVPGVTLAGFPAATKTDATGYYIALVPKDWSGTVTPQFGAYTFDPPFLPYSNPSENQPDQNYVATPPPVVVTITSCPAPSGTARPSPSSGPSPTGSRRRSTTSNGGPTRPHRALHGQRPELDLSGIDQGAREALHPLPQSPRHGRRSGLHHRRADPHGPVARPPCGGGRNAPACTIPPRLHPADLRLAASGSARVFSLSAGDELVAGPWLDARTE